MADQGIETRLVDLDVEHAAATCRDEHRLNVPLILNVAFMDVQPGGSVHYSFVANDPGAFMFHCGTKPVLAHIANGMYGAIIVEPRTPLPRADKNYVLVASEWYLSSPGFPQPAGLDMAKAQRQEPDWTTWNGTVALRPFDRRRHS